MVAVVVGCVTVAVVVAFATLAYRRRWLWTGIPADAGDGTSGMPPRPAKTLWDWLQLAIVPLAVALAVFALNAAQADREAKRADERAKLDREIEDRRAERERVIADDRAQNDSLRAYLQQMSELIVRQDLMSRRRAAGALALAQTLTFTILRQLDGRRKGIVVRFLADAKLIQNTFEPPPIIDLTDADLRGAVLRSAWLDQTYFGGADLRGADFESASLDGAYFVDANLRGARFVDTTIDHAYFSGADLRDADFTDAGVLDDRVTRHADRVAFSRSCLSGARFVNGALTPALFDATAGRNVDFSGASLGRASFDGAELANVGFEGAERDDPTGRELPEPWTPPRSGLTASEIDTRCKELLPEVG